MVVVSRGFDDGYEVGSAVFCARNPDRFGEGEEGMDGYSGRQRKEKKRKSTLQLRGVFVVRRRAGSLG